MKKLMLYIILFGLVVNTYSQKDAEIDSLKTLLYETPDIEEKVKLYYLLSRTYHFLDGTQANEYAWQGIMFSKNSNYHDYTGSLYRSLGDIAVIHDSMSVAKAYFLKAQEYFVELDQQQNLAEVYTVLGNIEFMQSKYSTALDYYLQAIELSTKNNYKSLLPTLYLNVGCVDTELHKNADAIRNFHLAMEGYLDMDDAYNLGITYNNLGGVYVEMRNFDLARHFLSMSDSLFQQINYTRGQANCANDFARIEYNLGNYSLSIQYTDKSIELMVSEKKDRYSAPTSTHLSSSYLLNGKNYIKLNQTDKAIDFLNLAYKTATFNNQHEIIAGASFHLAEIYEQLNKLDSSIRYYKTFHAYSDSLTNEENIKQLAYLDAQFKYEQKQHEENEKRLIEEQKQRQTYLILTLVIVALFAVIIIMVLLLKLSRTRANRAELEQSALKTELDTRNKELTTHVMYQVKTNEFILNISKKLQSGLYKIKPENRSMIEGIIRDLERDSDSNAWDEFEVRFHQVHADFNKKLIEKFPDLTANELRLSAFLRLNMSSKDISAITYQTPNSIDTARSRLRQKLGLRKDDNLIAFLSKF